MTVDSPWSYVYDCIAPEANTKSFVALVNPLVNDTCILDGVPPT